MSTQHTSMHPRGLQSTRAPHNKLHLHESFPPPLYTPTTRFHTELHSRSNHCWFGFPLPEICRETPQLSEAVSPCFVLGGPGAPLCNPKHPKEPFIAPPQFVFSLPEPLIKPTAASDGAANASSPPPVWHAAKLSYR